MEIECATLFPPPAECADSQQLTAASLLIYYTARKERYGYINVCDVMSVNIQTIQIVKASPCCLCKILISNIILDRFKLQMLFFNTTVDGFSVVVEMLTSRVRISFCVKSLDVAHLVLKPSKLEMLMSIIFCTSSHCCKAFCKLRCCSSLFVILSSSIICKQWSIKFVLFKMMKVEDYPRSTQIKIKREKVNKTRKAENYSL